jgi:hypothetical protein
MDNPAAKSLMETIRKINDIAYRARCGEPSVEDYLRAVSSDPVTEWFTVLLREKSEELDREKQRADQLACALRTWYRTRDARESARQSGELQLINVLESMGIIEA